MRFGLLVAANGCWPFLAYLDPTRRADTDFPLKYLPPGDRGRLLDLGCGSGDLLGTKCGRSDGGPRRRRRSGRGGNGAS